MRSLSKVVTPPRGAKADVRLQGAYNRVFFEGGATQEDRDIVLTDMAVFTRHFFPDGFETSLEEIHQNNGKRMVMSRLVRLGFSGKTDLSSLYEATVAETVIDQNHKEK